MSKRRYAKRGACHRFKSPKTGYRSLAIARYDASKVQEHAAPGVTVSVFKCECGWWHIGTEET